jgi:hypothetical protein
MTFRMDDDDMAALAEIQSRHGFRSRAETMRFVMAVASSILQMNATAEALRTGDLNRLAG